MDVIQVSKDVGVAPWTIKLSRHTLTQKVYKILFLCFSGFDIHIHIVHALSIFYVFNCIISKYIPILY